LECPDTLTHPIDFFSQATEDVDKRQQLAVKVVQNFRKCLEVSYFGDLFIYLFIYLL